MRRPPRTAAECDAIKGIVRGPRSRVQFRRPNGGRTESSPTTIAVPPFSGPVIRHLIYHIWPASHTDTWRWNLEQLIARIDQFNGKRVVGISEDKKTVDPQLVVDMLAGHGVEFIVSKNNPNLGESVSWPKMMNAVASKGTNEIVFYGHAKGVKYAETDRLHLHMRRWTGAMYETLLDDPAVIDAALADHVFAGAFRRIPNRRTWFYSGAFFWFRSCCVFTRGWQLKSSKRWGVEFWPQTVCSMEQAACIRAENVGRMYDAKTLELVLNG